ncbi:MAG: hypothetical protein J2P13_01730 [Acidobacteria bacterium]|nr:hypothetical protein [Acidobacteriota bacterium]
MRPVLKLFRFPVLFLFMCLPGTRVYAQSAPATSGPGGGIPALPLPPRNARVFAMGDAMDVEPVKGVPFCATVVTEHTQLFPDGNRIHTSDESSLCRDNQGRTRREAGLNLLEAGSQTAPPKLITIMDPVAGYRYLLDSESKVAHRIPLGRGGPVPEANAPAKGQVVMYESVGAGGPEISIGRDVFFKTGRLQSPDAEATERLPEQDIEGIHATGKRMTTTIAAGKMGNEQPMTITSEQWYSEELKATVMTRHIDPWAGELKTQFKDVNRASPDPSLFALPADYKIVDDKKGPFVMGKRQLMPPPPPQP